MALLDRDFEGIIDIPSGKLKIDSMKIYNTDKDTFTLSIRLNKGTNPKMDFVSEIEISKYRVELIVIKPVSNQVKIIEGSSVNDMFYFDLNEDFNNVVGKYICQFYIYFDKPGSVSNMDDDERITSDAFAYTVSPCIVTGLNEGIQKDPDLPVLRNLIEEVKLLGGLTLESPDTIFSDYYKKVEIDEKLSNLLSNADIDLENLQSKTDLELTTVNKTIVGAINEINGSLPHIISENIITKMDRTQLLDIIRAGGKAEISRFSIDTTKTTYAVYNGKEYLAKENSTEQLCFDFNDFSLKIRHGYTINDVMIGNVSAVHIDNVVTSNINEVTIIQRTYSYLDNNLLSEDLDIGNSISMNRYGKIGKFSTAIGYNVSAQGDFSYSEGEGTIASSNHQHAQGRYNIEDKNNTYAHIIGSGTSNLDRSNIYTLDWSGNGWYKGKLSQDGAPENSKDLVTKGYVDDKISTMFNINSNGELEVTINGVTLTFVPKNETSTYSRDNTDVGVDVDVETDTGIDNY